MVFGNGVKSIQAAAYNGARTVIRFKTSPEPKNLMLIHGPKSKISSLKWDIHKVCQHLLGGGDDVRIL